MYIGYFESDTPFTYTKIGTNLPCAPTSVENGVTTFSWKQLYYTGVDIQIDLQEHMFVGSVTLPLEEGSQIRGFEVLADGRTVAKYTAETGKTAGGTLTVGVGAYASALILRIHTVLHDLSFTAPEIAVCRREDSPFTWPMAKTLMAGEELVRISDIKTATAHEDEKAAADLLRERLTERFGQLNEGGVCATLVLAADGYDGERYTVDCTKNGIVLTAGSRFMLMYAVCKLLDLCRNGACPIAHIEDCPTKPLRGIHLYLPAVQEIEFFKRLVRYVLLPLGYNTMFIEFAGAMRFDRHPEISEGWLRGVARAKAGLQPYFPHSEVAEGELLEKWQVAELFDYIKEFGIEPIPEIQSLGHVQYITYAHPEIAERVEVDEDVTDTRNEDARPENFYAHCYCPSNEKSYEIIFDIIDEILEVTKPQRYVHIGHDEVYHLGLCPKCKNTPHDVLLARHINRLYDYLKQKGLGTIMWSDMLQPCTKYQTANAANLIPKDILCLDFIWYFHFDKDLENNLLPLGFRVAVGNLYSSHYPRYRQRMMQDGMVGGQVSMWALTKEANFGRRGKIFDLTYTAQMLWNAEQYDPALREIYAHLISKRLQPVQRDEMRGKYCPAGYASTEIPLPRGNHSLPEELLAYRPQAIVADGCEVQIQTKVDRLAIEHTTLQAPPHIEWAPNYVCGTYTVTYEDGEKVTVPAEHFGNVQHYNRKYGDPLQGAYHRHNGYVGTWFSDPTLEEKFHGEDVLLTAYIWENPHPEKRITLLSYAANEDDCATVILTGVKILNKK